MYKHLLLKYLLFQIIILPSRIIAQDINYDEVILPENASQLDIEERLVQLAWKNNPISKIQQKNIELAKRNIVVSQTEWLNNVRFTSNINEFIINPASDEQNRAQFFPLYNISLSLPLGLFVTTPQIVKSARIQQDIELQNLNQQKLQMRSMVRKLYQIYLSRKNALTIQSEITENMYNSFVLVEDQFKTGEATLEEYNQAFEEYKMQQINQLSAEEQLNIAIINIEEIIGIDFQLVVQ